MDLSARPSLVAVAAAIAIAACTPSNPVEREEPPAATPPAPVPVEIEGPIDGPGCAPRFADDPWVVATPQLQPTALSSAAAWSSRVDAVGGYDHSVGMDADGAVAWGHDTKNMVFAVDRFDRDGNRTWRQVLDPPQLEPEALEVTQDGEILVAGTSFASGSAGGQWLVALDATRQELWRQRTPRVRVHSLARVSSGRTVMLGSTHRQEVTLGGHLMHNQWLPRGHAMDIVALLDSEGAYQWSTAFLPGALGMAIQGDAFYLASNFGRSMVDYGSGLTEGPGVLAKFDIDGGRNLWSMTFETGLRAVLPHGGDLLVVGFDEGASMGGPAIGGTPAAWIDPTGCYRGSTSLGIGAARFEAGPDGSLILYGMAPTAPAIRQIGTTTFELPAGHWFVAGLDPMLQLQWLHTVACDGLHAAAGPEGRAAFSCFRDASRPGKTIRRYELFVLGE